MSFYAVQKKSLLLSNQHGDIATRQMKNHLITHGQSVSVNKVLVRLKEVNYIIEKVRENC